MQGIRCAVARCTCLLMALLILGGGFVLSAPSSAQDHPLAASAPPSNVPKVLIGRVVSVESGDELTIYADKKKYRIRLDGIDAPENGQPYFAEARQTLMAKVLSREVRVEVVSGTRSELLNGRVWLDTNRSVNKELVADGCAWYAEHLSKSTSLAAAQEQAQQNGRGLWASTEAEPPWLVEHDPSDAIDLVQSKQGSSTRDSERVAVRRPREARVQPRRDAKAGTSAEQEFAALLGELQAWDKDITQQVTEVRTAGQLRSVVGRAEASMENISRRFFQLAEKYPRTETAVRSLGLSIFCTNFASSAPDQERRVREATNKLLTDHLDSKDLFEVVPLVTPVDLPFRGDAFLQAVIDGSPHRDVQGVACLALAWRLHEEPMEPEREAAVVELLERVVKQYSDVKIGKMALGPIAEKQLVAVLSLAVGKVAPDIVGKDSAGQTMRLSDYRGQVVMLDFWVDWCPYCRQMYPRERSLMKQYEGEPFVILGVNCEDIADQRAAEKREVMSWRSWADGVGGPIAGMFNVTSFPTVIILDAEGVIRYKDVRGKAIDAAIETLMNELKGGVTGRNVAQVDPFLAPPVGLFAADPPTANL